MNSCSIWERIGKMKSNYDRELFDNQSQYGCYLGYKATNRLVVVGTGICYSVGLLGVQYEF